VPFAFIPLPITNTVLLEMKTDSIFYQLFQTSPNIFFELIGRSFTEGDSYEFKSVAVKQTNLTIDGVFLPLSESSSQIVYFV